MRVPLMPMRKTHGHACHVFKQANNKCNTNNLILVIYDVVFKIKSKMLKERCK